MYLRFLQELKVLIYLKKWLGILVTGTQWADRWIYIKNVEPSSSLILVFSLICLFLRALSYSTCLSIFFLDTQALFTSTFQTLVYKSNRICQNTCINEMIVMDQTMFEVRCSKPKIGYLSLITKDQHNRVRLTKSAMIWKFTLIFESMNNVYTYKVFCLLL